MRGPAPFIIAVDAAGGAGTVASGALGMRQFVATLGGARFMLKYIELKAGHSDNRPAWIARVKLSKTGRTVYFGAKALRRATGRGISGNTQGNIAPPSKAAMNRRTPQACYFQFFTLSGNWTFGCWIFRSVAICFSRPRMASLSLAA